MSKGLSDTASTLYREANLDSPAVMKPLTNYQPFTYRSPANVGVSKNFKRMLFFTIFYNIMIFIV